MTSGDPLSNLNYAITTQKTEVRLLHYKKTTKVQFWFYPYTKD